MESHSRAVWHRVSSAVCPWRRCWRNADPFLTEEQTMADFRIKINDGPEMALPVKSTIYRDAAAAVPALFGEMLPCQIEIWAMHKGKELNRYVFRAREDEYGRFVLDHMVPS